MMSAKRIRWFIGVALIALMVVTVFVISIPILFHHKLQYISFFKHCFFVLLVCSVLCLYRVLRGPTAADRIVTIDIFGILIVGFCAVIGIPTGRTWYIDIGIAWTLQSFISTLALAKFLEGKDFDE